MTDTESRSMDADQLSRAVELFEKCLCLQAYESLRAWGPPQTWRGSEALVFAGRLVAHLGAYRLRYWLFRRAWREDPANPASQYYYAQMLWRKWGPYTALQWMDRHSALPGNPTGDIQASWYALHCTCYGILRDFDTAERWFRRADQTTPRNPWVKVCRAHLLEIEDKYEEALETTRAALEIRPFYTPAVQSMGHLLTLLDRDEEALDLLTQASQRIESNNIAAQLYTLQLELKLYGAARKSLDRYIELSQLADRYTTRWIEAQRSEIAYREGDIDGSIRHADLSGNDFLKEASANLRDASRAGRLSVVLPVGFVRQHHMTCAPATLSAISRYWSMPADHLQVAEEICYNGTSRYSERKWAQENGWVAREFSVTETSAVDLLDHGIPFTFTTVDPSSGHLQAVIGYDWRRGSLVIRDPFWRNSTETIAGKVLNRYRAYGPRGMALVPEGRREQLEGIDLPDACLWDQLHDLDRALVEHRRTEAQDICDHLQSTAAGHLLACHARHRLALYDCNPAERLAAVERLLEFAADDQVLQLERLGLLRDLAHRGERLETYKKLCALKDTHPVFWQQYAQELKVDARRHGDAVWLLQRAIHRWPTEANNYFILAGIYWDQRKFDEAFQLYRFAACLDDKNEYFANAYFVASIWRKQTDLTLGFLRDRFERFGGKSSLPARTLFFAYLRLDRTTEALNVVEQALKIRPDDGELILFAADACVSCSIENMARAEELLKRAEGKCPPGEWSRVAARIAASDGRLSEALAFWQKVLDIQPLAVDAHNAVAQLLAETQGPAEACSHLEQATERFPHHYPLQELRVQWMHDEPSEVREKVIRQAIAATPDNAYIHRELATLLADRRCFEEAWRQMETAGQLDPENSYRYSTEAYLLREEGKIDQARQSLRRAVMLSVDNSYAIAGLIHLCETVDERREVLGFVKEQLAGQVIFGDGLLEFRAHASEAFQPEEVLALLREGLKERPDLWHVWSSVILQLLDMKQFEEADRLSIEATGRFPLLPLLWLERASVCRARGESEAELEALETAYQINPNNGSAVRALCERHNRRGNFMQSKRLLERATARTPLDIPNHIQLAETLWKLQERDPAIDRIQHVIQLEPGYDHAWDLLNEWTEHLGCPERALETARELSRRRPGEVRSWRILARLLDAPEQLEERLQALDKILDLNPRYQEAYDLRAQSLAAAGRWTEAQQACCPPAWGDCPPVRLRARAAWIESERGNLDRAIDLMRQVLNEDPFLFHAWSWLAEWYSRANRCADYESAAEAMIRLRPRYEIGYGCLGEARLLRENFAGAREAFHHALELNPTYEFAGEYLFDLQLADNDIPGAVETVSKLRKHTNNAFVAAREVQLAAKRTLKDEAVEALTRTCSMKCESTWPVSAAVSAMVEAGWKKDVERILESLLDGETTHPETGRQWVQLCTGQGDWQCLDRLPELVRKGEIGFQATDAYMEAFTNSNSASEFRRVVEANREWLRAHTSTWGSAGYGLIAAGEYKFAAMWYADWRERPDATSWMLLHAAEAFRAVRLDSEASEASRDALPKAMHDSMPLHHIWLAFDEICAGNIAEAGKHLESARGEKLNPNYSFLVTVMQCVVKMAQASFKESDRVFCEIDHLLKHARFTYSGYSLQPARRRIYRKCLEEIAGYRKGAAGSLWHLNRRIKSYLPGIRGTSGSAGSGRENTETGYRPTRTSFGWLWFFMIFILVSQFGRLFNRQNPGNKYVPVLSQYETALNYELGNGVPRDYAMAAEWYRKAAERGHSDAQYTLGTMYESGRGVVGNCATAAAWYQRAAERGHPNAQYRLGLMCESGAAGVKDNILAYMWLSLSIMSNGLNSGDAEKRVREIAESMTPLQKETAQRMTREWKPIE